MPEISRFLGIIVRMYYRDHSPPHFHARYGDAEAKVGIGSLELISGRQLTNLEIPVVEQGNLR